MKGLPTGYLRAPSDTIKCNRESREVGCELRRSNRAVLARYNCMIDVALFGSEEKEQGRAHIRREKVMFCRVTTRSARAARPAQCGACRPMSAIPKNPKDLEPPKPVRHPYSCEHLDTTRFLSFKQSRGACCVVARHSSVRRTRRARTSVAAGRTFRRTRTRGLSGRTRTGATPRS